MNQCRKMSSSRGYQVNFVRHPPREIPVKCAICLDVLFEPKVVSCCGHSFCAACIDRVVRCGKPCPLCSRPFTVTDNQWLKRTLKDYDVYCPHRDKGCEWIGQLRQVENHLNQDPLPDKLCQYQEIQCQHCQTHLCERRLMPNHVSNDCPFRDLECRYRHVGCKVKKPQQQMEEHMREAVSDHLNLVTKNLSRKGNEIAELKRRYWMLTLLLILAAFHAYIYQAQVSESKMEVAMKELVRNFSSEIAKLNHGQRLLKKRHNSSSVMVANFTNLNSEVQTLSSDINQIRNNITQIKTTADDAMVEVGKIKQTVESIPSVKARINEIEKQVISGKEELRKLRKLIQTEKNNLARSIDRTRKDLVDLESIYWISTKEKRKELLDIKKKQENINSMIIWACGGSKPSSVAKEFEKMKSEVWYISQQADFPILPVSLNMTRVKERKDSRNPWFSMPFYTHQEGYKMRLVVYPDGKRSGAGTHISVAIYLMSGKYDAKLEWPLNITLEITLVNQLFKDTHTISRVYRSYTSFHNNDITGRVQDDTMAKHGIIYPLFASHKYTISYVEYDSLYFKVSRVEYM